MSAKAVLYNQLIKKTRCVDYTMALYTDNDQTYFFRITVLYVRHHYCEISLYNTKVRSSENG